MKKIIDIVSLFLIGMTFMGAIITAAMYRDVDNHIYPLTHKLWMIK